MVAVEEEHRGGLECERRRQGTSPITQPASDPPRARRLLGPLRLACGVLMAGLVLTGAGQVSVAEAATITEFAITASSAATGITAGPDGALWFTEVGGNKIGRITTAGSVTEFAVPTAFSGPVDITAGPDGALWFTEFTAEKIGRITTLGAITEFPLHPTAASSPNGIAAGPDGALWFTEFNGNRIGRITTGGSVTEFPLPAQSCCTVGITAGPDGALWFTLLGGGIGRITTASDSAAASAFVTRLYEQVLSREPDAAGLQAFVAQIQQFGSVVPTVLAFFHSPEFLGRNTTNEQFLTICYHTFLDREPDPVGFDAFVSDLNSGLRSRDNLLDIFLDSQEFAALASFLPPQDPVTAFVTNLYVRILGRGPDLAGLQGFVTQLQQTRTVLPTVLNFLHSPEFLNRNTNNTEYVTVLYRVFLDRVPDAGGLAGWVALLTQGTATRDQLAAQFAASPEFQAIQHQLFP